MRFFAASPQVTWLMPCIAKPSSALVMMRRRRWPGLKRCAVGMIAMSNQVGSPGTS